MVGGFDFWGEGPLVGAKFPAGAAHGWWEGGKVLAALSSVTTRRALFPLLVVYNLFHQSVCAADIQLVLNISWSGRVPAPDMGLAGM